MGSKILHFIDINGLPLFCRESRVFNLGTGKFCAIFLPSGRDITFSDRREKNLRKFSRQFPTRPNEKWNPINGVADLMLHYDFDLLSKWNIYYKRGCEEYKVGFSKQRILQEPKFNYNSVNKVNFFFNNSFALLPSCECFSVSSTQALSKSKKRKILQVSACNI
jgi:hypothetical protein